MVDNLTPARVLALTQVEAEASPSVVSSQLSSVGTTYTVLIDSGATHSFFPSRVIDRLCSRVIIILWGLGLYCLLGSW